MPQSAVEANMMELAGVRSTSAGIPMVTDVGIWEAEAGSCSLGWVTMLPVGCLHGNDDVVHDKV